MPAFAGTTRAKVFRQQTLTGAARQVDPASSRARFVKAIVRLKPPYLFIHRFHHSVIWPRRCSLMSGGPPRLMPWLVARG